jgi:hypothetical protein
MATLLELCYWPSPLNARLHSAIAAVSEFQNLLSLMACEVIHRGVLRHRVRSDGQYYQFTKQRRACVVVGNLHMITSLTVFNYCGG